MRGRGFTAEEATTYVAERWPHLGRWNRRFDSHLLSLDTRAHGPSGGA